MSKGKAANRTEGQSPEQWSSGLLNFGLLKWNSCSQDSYGQNSYGIGAAAAAGGAVGAALFDQTILVGATAGLSVLAHFLLCRIMSAW